MSYTYSATMPANLVAAFTLIDDGDPRAMGPLMAILEAIIDNQSKIATSRWGWHQAPLTPFALTGFAVPTPTSLGNYGVIQTSVAGTPMFWVPLPTIGEDSQITEVVAVLSGDYTGGSAHGGLPASLPNLSLFRVDYQIGGITALGNQLDTSGSVGAYDAGHTITLTGLTEDISETRSHVAQIIGETGANSQINTMMVHAIRYKVEPAP